MPSFVNPTLLWGLAILAVPVVIHLINLMRHRKVEWAAMEFLLTSQRKNSRWIRIKELLLLLLRMAAIAAVVLVLAQPLLDYQLAARLGGQRTHHIVLLDDSYSMADRRGESSAFERGKDALVRLGEQIAQTGAPQTFTLLRFSRSTKAAEGSQADLLEQTVTSDFAAKLKDLLTRIDVSQTAVGPAPAIEAIGTLLGDPEGERRVVYLVTDFRARQWDEPGDMAAMLERLSDSGVDLQFIACVDSEHANVGIAALHPEPGTRAAGVPLAMGVTLENFGSELLKNVTVTLEEDGVRRPAVVFDELPPGESESRTFAVNFATAGEHVVAAAIESDAVSTDNSRFAVLDVPLDVPILIIDAEPDAPQARVLSTALAPGGSVRTGITPRIELPAFLNSHPLESYRAIYLVNFESLDEPAITALEKYVRGGGGVAIFTGAMTQTRFINEQLYRDGQGLFPAPLEVATHLLVDRLEKAADLQVGDHPVFRVFAGERNPFVSDVLINQFLAVPRTWKPEPNSGVRVAASLRNGLPLVLEKTYGAGRVLAILTTAGPVWNNWAGNPSFVIVALEMQAYLSHGEERDQVQLVGTPIKLTLDAQDYQPQFRVNPPADHPEGSTIADATAHGDSLELRYDDTSTSGVYDVQLTTTAGVPESRRVAINVEPDEGDLAILDGQQLATRLPSVDYELWQVDRFSFSDRKHAGTNWSDWLLYGLAFVLVGEQVLAYSASYHPKSLGGVR